MYYFFSFFFPALSQTSKLASSDVQYVETLHREQIVGSLKLQVQTVLRGKRYQAKIDQGPVVPGHMGYLLPKQHKLVVGYGPGAKITDCSRRLVG